IGVTFIALGLLAVKQDEVVGIDESRRDRILDEARSAAGREFAATAAESAHTDAVEFVADVVEFAVERGLRPSQPGGRVDRGRNLSPPGEVLSKDVLGQGDDEQPLAA